MKLFRTPGITMLGRGAATVAAAVVLCAASACHLLAPDKRYTIRVDSIGAPAEAGRLDTMRVRFWGWVGPNGCFSVDRIEKRQTPLTLEITFHGVEQGGMQSCTQMVVQLDHVELVPPPLAHPFVIRVHEPSGSDLTKTVSVRP